MYISRIPARRGRIRKRFRCVVGERRLRLAVDRTAGPGTDERTRMQCQHVFPVWRMRGDRTVGHYDPTAAMPLGIGIRISPESCRLFGPSLGAKLMEAPNADPRNRRVGADVAGILEIPSPRRRQSRPSTAHAPAEKRGNDILRLDRRSSDRHVQKRRAWQAERPWFRQAGLKTGAPDGRRSGTQPRIGSCAIAVRMKK